MERVTSAAVNENVLKLQTFLEQCPAGVKLSWDEITARTGIEMDAAGRNQLRSASHRAWLEYIANRGEGITLADKTTGLQIVKVRIQSIVRVIRRGERTYRNITQQFASQMSPQDQQALNYSGAAFAALGLSIKLNRQAICDNRNIPKSVEITLPEVPR